MYFKKTLVINKLHLRAEESVEIKSDDGTLTATFEQLPEEDRKHGLSMEDSLCTVESQRDAPADVLKMFECLRDYVEHPGFRFVVMPEGEHRSGSWMRWEGERWLDLNCLPDELMEYCMQVSRELRQRAIDCVGVIRWRLGLEGPHNPVRSTKDTEWSLDGEHWRAFPFGLNVKASVRGAIDMPPGLAAQIAKDIAAADTEPFEHVLLREAWQQRNRNPRSALVIGYAAAEIGVKFFVGELVPSMKKFVADIPSPPLVKILSKYLDTLPAKLKIDGQVKPPPKSIRKAIRQGMDARNSLAHIGIYDLTPDDLESILEAVRDLLYLLDYYRGHEWALDRLRDETRAELMATS